GIEHGPPVPVVLEGAPAPAHAAQHAGAVVGEEVEAVELGDRATAIYVASDDRTASGVAVLEDGHGEARAIALESAVAARARGDVPAEIMAHLVAARHGVDHLPALLTHVRDVHMTGAAIEAIAPGMAQAHLDDLHGRSGRVHVDAKHLAAPRAAELGMAARI